MEFLRAVIKAIKKLIIWFFILSVGLVIFYRFVPPPITVLMLIRLKDQAMEDKPLKLKKTWKSLNEISKHMPQAVIAAEDQQFMYHFGMDIEAVEKAYKDNTKGKRLRGGSTITQQTAKNVFLWPGRNYVRKALELYFSFLIEIFWGKERIMEVYLNVIEMGPGIYGTEAAAETYYKKPAASLTKAESALIAATLPNPLRWSPGNPTSYIYGRQSWILRNMNNLEQVEF